MRNWHNRLALILLLCFASIQAQAAIWIVGNSYAIESGGSGFLDDATLYPNVSSLVAGQIAAGVAASVANNSPVSEEFLNLIASPADGSAQSAGDFHNGAAATTDGDELALSGVAGTSTNYLSGDGSADLSVLKAFGANSMLADWHRSDQSGFWVACAFRYDDAHANAAIIGNRKSSADLGFSIRTLSDAVWILQSGGSGNMLVTFDTTLVDGTDYLLIFTWDGSSGTNNLKLALNSDTVTETKSGTFQTSTTTSTGLPSFFANIDAGVPMAPATRWYGHAWGTGFIGNTEFAEIRDYYQLNTPIP